MNNPLHEHQWHMMEQDRNDTFYHMLYTKKPYAKSKVICICGETKEVEVTLEFLEIEEKK